MKVGVLAVQGAVSEHADALGRAGAEPIAVRTPEDLAEVRGLVLPGGESTTISRLLRSSGLQDAILARHASGDLALFGTCAGMILLSRRATHDVDDKDIELLGVLDATVDRNAFGRQRESFEANLDIAGIGAMHVVFIRAPALDDCKGEVLARHEDRIVAVRDGKVLATAFHPELTGDDRLHELFVSMC